MGELEDLKMMLMQLAQAQLRTEEAHQRTEEALQGLIASQRKNEAGFRLLKVSRRQTDQALRKLKFEMDANVQAILAAAESNREEGRAQRRQMNKVWGELANKWGTVLEDVAAPNVRRLAAEEFGISRIEDFAVRSQRVSRSAPARDGEFDVVCAGPGKVIYAEMKSTSSSDSILRFRRRLDEFFDFFPEYRGRELIGIYASWSLEEKLRPALSATGLYGMAMGEETMEIVVRPLSQRTEPL